MVCTANDLSAWKDFPKGLRVLLVDEDTTSATEMKSKLESMDYVVSTFCNETEALTALSSKSESFHVAIIEVSTTNSNGCFKFLESAKDLPTIMTSNIHCLSTMMKCIALGAVEFLRKPLSEDKLRNIWQHVVHKAFNAGESVFSESLKPIKDSVVSMLQLKVETENHKNENFDEGRNMSCMDENDHEQLQASDKYPAPSTPQLKQGARLLDDADCQDNTNFSTEKDSGELEGELKSVETSSEMAEATLEEGHTESIRMAVIKEEDDSILKVKGEDNICAKGESNTCSHQEKEENNKCSPAQNKEKLNNSDGVSEAINKASGQHISFGAKSNRKKIKVDWTPDLHKKFVQAVEQLGVDQAIPSRILELMKVEGLTRHNVASHLQKYRMHRRHILPKEDDRRLVQQRDHLQRSFYPHKPIIAYPSYHSNHALPPASVYPMWGGTGSHGVQMWGPPGYPPWPLTDGWHWKPYTGMHADAWGCPVMPPPHSPYSSSPSKLQNSSGFHGSGMVDNSCSLPQKSFDLQPAEEIVDKVVKEAISKPWLPLPLGLKPPSTDGVLAELSRQGISRIPPHINGSSSF